MTTPKLSYAEGLLAKWREEAIGRIRSFTYGYPAAACAARESLGRTEDRTEADYLATYDAMLEQNGSLRTIYEAQGLKPVEHDPA